MGSKGGCATKGFVILLGSKYDTYIFKNYEAGQTEYVLYTALYTVLYTALYKVL